MQTWTGPLLAAVTLLLAAGAAKLVRPAATAAALTRAFPAVGSSRAQAAAVRALGAVEVLVALMALVWHGPLGAWVVAAAYASFAAYAAVTLTRGGAADCGCFGQPAPLGVTHVVADIALAACSAAYAATAHGGVLVSLAHHPVAGFLTASYGVGAAWLVYVVLTQVGGLMRQVAQLRGAAS